MKDIPFVPQPRGSRYCAAACASMLMNSYDIAHELSDIWDGIKAPNKTGGEYGATYLVARYLLNIGIPALTIRARDPIALLRECEILGIDAILCCRQFPELDYGHSLVLLEVENDHVICHDPEVGPSQRISLNLLAKLFLPLGPNSEITPRILTLVGKRSANPSNCLICGSINKQVAQCPNPPCRAMVPIPFGVFSACSNHCVPSKWVEEIICPGCDCSFAI